MRFVVALIIVLAATARGEERVPGPLALKVMLKVLSYDPGLAQRGAGDFVVAIPFAPGTEAAAETALRECNALEVKSVNDRPLKFTTVPSKDLAASQASAMLLVPGLDDDARRAAIKWSREAKVYSLSLTEQGVLDGALLGVGVANDKPQPLINVATARALGADFKAVLRLARIVQ